MTNKKIKQKLEEAFEEVFLEDGHCILMYSNKDNTENKICATAAESNGEGLLQMVTDHLKQHKFLIPLFLEASALALTESEEE